MLEMWKVWLLLSKEDILAGPVPPQLSCLLLGFWESSSPNSESLMHTTYRVYRKLEKQTWKSHIPVIVEIRSRVGCCGITYIIMDMWLLTCWFSWWWWEWVRQAGPHWLQLLLASFSVSDPGVDVPQESWQTAFASLKLDPWNTIQVLARLHRHWSSLNVTFLLTCYFQLPVLKTDTPISGGMLDQLTSSLQ